MQAQSSIVWCTRNEWSCHNTKRWLASHPTFTYWQYHAQKGPFLSCSGLSGKAQPASLKIFRASLYAKFFYYAEIFWLNQLALLNISNMEVTLDVFQDDRLLLKAVAQENMYSIVVTWEVSHDQILLLEVLLPANKLDTSMTLDTQHVSIGHPYISPTLYPLPSIPKMQRTLFLQRLMISSSSLRSAKQFSWGTMPDSNVRGICVALTNTPEAGGVLVCWDLK